MNISKLISLSFLVAFVSPLGLNFRFFDDVSMNVSGYILLSFANFLLFWAVYGITSIYEKKTSSIVSASGFILVVTIAFTILWFLLMVDRYIPHGMFWVLELLMKLSVGPVIILLLMYPWIAGERITNR